MANHFPAVPSGFVICSVSYYMELAAGSLPLTGANAGKGWGKLQPGVPSGQPLLTAFWSFDTGTTDSSGNEVYDYADWDQDSFEAALVTALTGIGSFAVASLGVPQATVAAAISLSRQWQITWATAADIAAWGTAGAYMSGPVEAVAW